MHATLPLLISTDFPALRRARLETLQINVGYRCNQSCLHCHVNAGPSRKEEMSLATAETVINFLDASGVSALDITGGAPELNAQFRHLVSAAHRRNVHVIDRCNLTVLEQPGQEDTAEFLAAHHVEITASLPCYLQDNVDAQRGSGVYDASIRALQRLNKLGYGQDNTGLILNLMYNPIGPYLPPPQCALEGDYKKYLGEQHGIVFTKLHTLTNMPIQRFGSALISKGEFHDYMALLRSAHSDANLPGVMCRTLLSVDWQGYVYDCDFNQMLDMPLCHTAKPRTSLSELIGVDLEGQPIRIADLCHTAKPRTSLSELIGVDLEGQPIRIADHCYGCTAGQGSSCGGALD